MRTLFEHADIVTVDEKENLVVLKDAFLGVDGKLIDYVGNARPAGVYDTVKNYSGKTLLPGLINTHCHSPMTLLRGLGSDKPLHIWLTEYMFPTEDRLRAQDIRTGTELALLEMVSTGTTSFTDMYNFTDETVDACIAAGVKANVCRPVQAFDPSEPYEKNFRAKEAFDLFKRRNGDGDGLIKVDFSIHAEYTCSEHVARAFCEEALPYGSRMHIHLSETEREHNNCIAKYGKTPAEWFRDAGAFRMPACAAHCVWLTESDMAILRDNGVSVMHNPSSNMKLGSGFAPVEKMRAYGINVALGTDGAASNNNLNMFEELHLASVIHNGYQKNAEVMNPSYTLLMATLNGAKLQQRPETGALLPGKRADIIAVDMDKPHLYPNPDTLATLCYSAQGSDVCLTMADGRVLYENGEFLTLDRERILAAAKDSCRYLYGA